MLDNGEWSALNEATFYVEPFARAGDLVISELNYNATFPTRSEITAAGNLPEPQVFEGGDYDFLEIHNVAGHAVNLDGVRLFCGVVYQFGNYTMMPDERIVVVDNLDAFTIRYGALPATVFGPYAGGLDDGGELITMVDRDGVLLQEFTYNDGNNWPGRADGFGSSLEIVDNLGNFNDGDNWRSSCEYNGSPGYAGAGFAGTIVINEVLAHTDPPSTDTIELHNTTGSPIDIGGWFLSDDRDFYKKFEIPGGTVVPGNGYVVFDESDFNSSGTFTDFALSASNGDDVWLLSADGSGKLLKFIDHVEFGASLNGESFGRWPNGTGILTPMASNTFGAANSGPRLGTIIISEIMYAPLGGNQNLEYIELCNTGGTAQNMENWTLRGGVDFDFTSAHIIPAGGIVVLVPFDLTSGNLTFFRNHYGIDPSVVIIGPWDAGERLNNAGDEVRLQRPDTPPPGDPNFYPQVIEDRVFYDDVAPWPTSADGGGDALHRIAAASFGNDVASWQAAAPTSGSKDFAPLTGYAAWQLANFGPGSPAGSLENDDPDCDGIENLAEYAFHGAGLDPNVADADILPVSLTLSGNTIVFEYYRDPAITDLAYQVERSPDLDAWTDTPSNPVAGNPDYFEATYTMGPILRQALRLRLTRQ